MRSIRSICLYTVIACFFLFFPAITFAQEAGDISALGYVEGEVGTEYCPDDLLSVKAVVTVNNTSDEQLSFFLRIAFAGEGEAHVDETTLDPGDPGELRGEHSTTAPDADSTSAEVSVYWLDRSGPNEPVLRLLGRKTITFTRRDDCGCEPVDPLPVPEIIFLPTHPSQVGRQADPHRRGGP